MDLDPDGTGMRVVLLILGAAVAVLATALVVLAVALVRLA